MRVKFSTAKKGLKSAKRDGVKRVEAKLKRLACEDSKARWLSFGNGKVEGLELRILSLESSRKGWDQGPVTKNGLRPIPRFKSKATSSSLNCSVRGVAAFAKIAGVVKAAGGAKVGAAAAAMTAAATAAMSGSKQEPTDALKQSSK
ncbi:hypothetical protein F0562_025815 [Nyssa sinensis]|uniref:Uncharacterized protein n=1 Tax=Nyssa sinensis TaxID=561372 RepID=A0A5J5B7C9_9ASTE|nr:hypothetical protein F0562_025815 [Nyssa sinensis]